VTVAVRAGILPMTEEYSLRSNGFAVKVASWFQEPARWNDFGGSGGRVPMVGLCW
jgi:hypothetical protein